MIPSPSRGGSVEVIYKMKLMSQADMVGKALSDMLSEAKLSYDMFVTGCF